MKYKNLGNSPTKVSAIGQGCMGLGGYLSKDTLNDERHEKALRLGIDIGMTFIDTAEGYGNGHSEEVVARAVEGIRDEVFIATKVSPENLPYDDVLLSAEGSLRRLKTDFIDLYQIHWPNPKIPISETMLAMERLIDEGKIRYVGMSNFSLKELKEAESLLDKNKMVSIQVEYNLFDRSIESNILPYCEGNGITTIAYSPLDHGKIVCGERKHKVLQAIAEKYNKTMAQITLKWLIAHPTVITIPKATNPEHIKENASSADFELAEEDFEEIFQIFTRECVYVPTERIRVITESDTKVYQTIKDAIANKLGFVPSPVDLAQDLKNGEVLKPVRLIATKDITGEYDYDLIEGRVRYWAWVIAHNGKVPIPAYVREN
jgi:diketogulonate reductase-like aldo/keto reductase